MLCQFTRDDDIMTIKTLRDGISFYQLKKDDFFILRYIRGGVDAINISRLTGNNKIYDKNHQTKYYFNATVCWSSGGGFINNFALSNRYLENDRTWDTGIVRVKLIASGDSCEELQEFLHNVHPELLI